MSVREAVRCSEGSWSENRRQSTWSSTNFEGLVGQESVWKLIKEVSEENQLGGMKSARPKWMPKSWKTAKQIGQRESRKKCFASCLDVNGRPLVSTQARHDAKQLQQESKCENQVGRWEWAACKQSGLQSGLWKRQPKIGHGPNLG